MPDHTALPSLLLDEIQFLRDVAAGRVNRLLDGRDKLRTPNRSSFVHLKVKKMEDAGLIQLEGSVWCPTEIGAAVLAAREALTKQVIETRAI